MAVFFSTLMSSCMGIAPRFQHTEILKRWANPAQGSQFLVMGDKKLHYRISGHGPVLVMIPGTVDSLHTWDSIVTELEKKYTVVRFDVPGFGFSDSPEFSDGYFTQPIIAEMHTFFDYLKQTLGVTRLHLMGHSLGGGLAWLYAVQYPNEVDHLILESPAAYPQAVPWFLHMDYFPIRELLLYSNGYLPLEMVFTQFQAIDSGIVGENYPQELLRPQMQRFTELFQTEVNMPKYLNTLHYELNGSRMFAESDMILEIKSPLMIIDGALDDIVPVSQVALWRRDQPHGRFEIWPKAGHYVHLFDPPGVVAKVLDFLKN